MNYCEKIPVKTRRIVLSGVPERVDCEGLEVTVLAKGSDVYLKADETVSNENAFIIENGKTVTLCGSFVLSGTSAEARLLYCKVI